jgi:hypothetical protein
LERLQVFRIYKQTKRQVEASPVTNEELSAVTGSSAPDYEQLLQAVLETPTGKAHATQYHRNVEALLTAIFYPSLVMPKSEHEIHDGRKRVDIRYTNNAQDGFFRWLRQHQVPCKYVFVECKNYGADVANPELDQLASRFSQLRGQVGILACRSFEKKDVFLKRCRDTALDHRGYVIAVDDEDLTQLVRDVQAALLPLEDEEEKDDDQPAGKASDYPLLHERFSGLMD